MTFVFDGLKDLTYVQLVDTLYETIDIDRFVFHLKIEVPYAMWTIPMAPALVKNYAHVSYYMKHKHRKTFSLRVSLVKKEIAVIGVSYRNVCRDNVMMFGVLGSFPNVAFFICV